MCSQASSAVLQAFLQEHDGEKVVMVADPPFGGLVKPLARSFSLISQTWRQLQNSGQSHRGHFNSPWNKYKVLLRENFFFPEKLINN